uniref:Ig-like domain-containing protein n=1 Tax=Astyanax mexicanus TaxID=7994 RepID=A0A3B1ISI5_ASTMX
MGATNNRPSAPLCRLTCDVYLFYSVLQTRSQWWFLGLRSTVLARSSVTLPCSISPSLNAVNFEVLWFRPQEGHIPILFYQEQEIQENPRNPQYQGRVSLIGGLDKGNVSVKLENIRLEDKGEYICRVEKTDEGEEHSHPQWTEAMLVSMVTVGVWLEYAVTMRYQLIMALTERLSANHIAGSELTVVIALPLV